MGAGCYYTHDNNDIENQRAFWIEIQNCYEDEDTGEAIVDEYVWEDTIDALGYVFEDLNYLNDDKYRWINNMYEIIIESTYYGDGAVVKLNPHDDLQSGLYALALHNHDRSYDRIKRELLKRGYKLRIATSGYTSCELTE